MEHVESKYGPKLSYCDSSYEAIYQADALAILTEWQVFRNPDLQKMKSLMTNPAIFDGRNVFDPDIVREAGFYYNSIGRP